MERYASRWAIETAFFDARQTLGVGEARNRTRLAVERTVPFGLLACTVVTTWYALAGHQPADTDEHRARARWYTTKTQPSFEDMTAKLRRTIIAHRFRGPRPHQAQPEEIQAVLTAWPPPEPDHSRQRNTRAEDRIGYERTAFEHWVNASWTSTAWCHSQKPGTAALPSGRHRSTKATPMISATLGPWPR
ncbi:hypothetical protein V2J94_29590 [Streptomyces sp. DSM 41524]|uniref:Transposase IS4-like domain-containing protein n=1 Tax=Streptomyces asiaticus subsp. ignotus TaxID=3098222 RepID=A0ABU7Q6M8_9ACTN|nr:hypothetical protein [Streptomyces sp. DSM 41524]